MMQCKTIEIRDKATFIPALAVRLQLRAGEDSAQTHYLARRAGYALGQPYVILTRLDAAGGKAHYDPFGWHDRTFTTAHSFLSDNWDTIADGAVIDVEFILGEREAPKRSERHEHGDYERL